jgi:hypothetical protein
MQVNCVFCDMEIEFLNTVYANFMIQRLKYIVLIALLIDPKVNLSFCSIT